MIIHGTELPDGISVESTLNRDAVPIDQENGQRRWQIQAVRVSTTVTYGDISFDMMNVVTLAEDERFMQDDYDVYWFERLIRERLLNDGYMQQIKANLDAAIAEAADGV